MRGLWVGLGPCQVGRSPCAPVGAFPLWEGGSLGPELRGTAFGAATLQGPGSRPCRLQPPAPMCSPPFPVPVYTRQAPAQVSGGGGRQEGRIWWAGDPRLPHCRKADPPGQ